MSVWQQCAGKGSVYQLCAENLLVVLSSVYSSVLPEKASNKADTGIIHVCLVYIRVVCVCAMLMPICVIQCSCL